MQRSQSRTILQGTAVFAVMMGMAIGCGQNPTEPANSARALADVAATVAQVASAVSGQPSPLADEQKSGKNLGFDTHTYPGNKTMQAWRQAKGAPYKWVGYYLPSPCHKDASWAGRRDTLTRMGWGLAVVYVGQQTWGRTPQLLSPSRLAALQKAGTSCNADFITAARGASDGRDAITMTTREGFPKRSIVFLDIERMEVMPPAMRDYTRAWARALLADGQYRPGVYVHKHNAQIVYDDLKAAFALAGVTEEPRVWIASGRGFDEGKAPQDVGFHFAGMWQGMIDVARAVADIKLPVDVNVSAWASPSAPERVGN